ncbi:AAA family ATPase [Plantactinospora endophytica]|uniref:ATPase AAA n=1 Tax=Plantactinospora endophytica TaxID=673535 RepID=A0ABQ4EF80_9ACTN|nr:MoxR family ATPase [Plantactinospora endophytica]GIG93304.1 ATPase AAA [Plantactinospora endophytica]
MTGWLIYRGDGRPHDGILRLPAPPNWRTFDGGPPLPTPSGNESGTDRRLGSAGGAIAANSTAVQMVNAALYLRRPLLVTGKPGVGKSALAFQVAHELQLGPVLTWPISSRSNLREGLYEYDPIGRLRDENLRQLMTTGRSNERDTDDVSIGRYLTLGPLGTALLPFDRPRVLLIDEIDKSDVDLPNDLLNVLEDGQYLIPELRRLAGQSERIVVQTSDPHGRAPVINGLVRCRAFPFIVLTSNDEREFPPAFLRRCIRLTLAEPTAEQLAAMVAAHLGANVADRAQHMIDEFTSRRNGTGTFATDQLLSAIYLRYSSADSNTDIAVLRTVVDHILADLNDPGPT